MGRKRIGENSPVRFVNPATSSEDSGLNRNSGDGAKITDPYRIPVSGTLGESHRDSKSGAPDTGAAEERAAAAQAPVSGVRYGAYGIAVPPESTNRTEGDDGDGDGCKPRLAARNDGVETPLLPAKEHPRPRNHRELGNAIFAAADPVKAGSELLEPGEERADPTRLRSLEMFAGWAFGNPDAAGHRNPPRIIWDIPGPPYEPVDPQGPEQEKLEGGEK